jgi:superfamily II DNA helicase RecQ
MLGCSFYSGEEGTGDKDQQDMHQSWINGGDQIMVCTSAFGAGNDYAHVRVVTHAGSPMEMVEYRYLVSYMHH